MLAAVDAESGDGGELTAEALAVKIVKLSPIDGTKSLMSFTFNVPFSQFIPRLAAGR